MLKQAKIETGFIKGKLFMVINGTWKNQPITISIKPSCLTISREEAGGTLVVSFDGAGRLWTALIDQVSYRRGLDGKLVAKWQTLGEGRERRWLAEAEARQQEEQARRLAAELLASLPAGQIRLEASLPPDGLAWLELAASLNPALIQADIARYHQIYKPVGILPPDQYMAVVLQATEGCSFNTCTFCSFYKDRPFRIKTPAEFSRHAQDVKDFIGRGMSLRRTIFLGDANALVVPMKQLLPLLEAVNSLYDVERLGGLFAFLDGFSGEKKSVADYRALREKGFQRIYIGLESGHEALLNFLRKPGRPADAVQAVRAMKAGGLSVGVIVLLGAGGAKFARQHVQDTIETLNAMHLDADDLVYFSELVLSEGMAYVQDAYQASFQPLSQAERVAQGEAIEHGLIFSPRRGVPHISRYDIREFVY
jgi:Radical SAM superfamily